MEAFFLSLNTSITWQTSKINLQIKLGFLEIPLEYMYKHVERFFNVNKLTQLKYMYICIQLTSVTTSCLFFGKGID